MNNSLILAIETSTKNCSVALHSESHVVHVIEELGDGYVHSEKLHLIIEDCLKKADIQVKDLKALAVSKGPGSYTGLRIGVSAVKGLAFPFNLPVVGMTSLEVLVQSVIGELPFSGVIIPMIDARRMEVYAGVYSDSGENIEAVNAVVIEEQSFLNYLEKGKVFFLGDGAEKCKTLITHPNAIFLDVPYPSAKFMGRLAFDLIGKKQVEDLAYFEPFYLKDFVAGKPKKIF